MAEKFFTPLQESHVIHTINRSTYFFSHFIYSLSVDLKTTFGTVQKWSEDHFWTVS